MGMGYSWVIRRATKGGNQGYLVCRYDYSGGKSPSLGSSANGMHTWNKSSLHENCCSVPQAHRHHMHTIGLGHGSLSRAISACTDKFVMAKTQQIDVFAQTHLHASNPGCLETRIWTTSIARWIYSDSIISKVTGQK